MKTTQVSLADCGHVTGILVSVDVLRAFSTAAYAFAAGVSRILLAGPVQDAFALKQSFPEALLAGENMGIQIPGFDFGNSPSQFDGLDLSGRTMILRTTAGTQGIVRGQGADHLLGCSFVCAFGTARYLRRLEPAIVSFVITGSRAGDSGDEDVACADYVAALLSGRTPDVQPFLDRVRNSTTAVKFVGSSQPDFLKTDLDYSLQANRFDWAMVVHRENGLLVMRTEQ